MANRTDAFPYRIYAVTHGINALLIEIAALPSITGAFPYQTAAMLTTVGAKAIDFCVCNAKELCLNYEIFGVPKYCIQKNRTSMYIHKKK